MVLTFVLQTVQGKAILQRHRLTKDARAVLKQLVDEHSNSTAGVIDAGEILGYLTTDTLDSNYSKPYYEYCILWDQKAITYNNMATSPLPPELLKAMLHRAVRLIPALRQVKNDDMQNVQRGKGALTYAQYLNLLLSAASVADEVRRGRGRSRSANVHDQTDDDDADTAHGHDASDESDAALQLFVHNVEG